MLNLKIIFAFLLILKISISCEGDLELKKSNDLTYSKFKFEHTISMLQFLFFLLIEEYIDEQTRKSPILSVLKIKIFFTC